jgi:putative ATPase
LQVDEGIEHRWLSEGRPYRDLVAKNASLEVLENLTLMLKRTRGQQLPQRLIHQRIIGSRRLH